MTWRKEERRESRHRHPSRFDDGGLSLQIHIQDRGHSFVWLNANDVALEAIPDHIDDEPTWPTDVTPVDQKRRARP